MAEVKPAARSRLRSDLGILGFVGGSHFFAHFYVLVLPPIFPLLARDLGVGYAALGFLLALSNVTTSVVQVPVGFLVDRFGARPLLVAGLILMGGGVTAMGLFPNYEAMAVFSIVVGLGNAVFHPADYAVLSSRISPARMGRAFSLHTFAGHLGWVVAPALVVGLTGLVSWQFALALLGSLGIVMALNVFLRGRSLDDDGTECASTAPHATKPAGLGDWRIIVWPPMLLHYFSIHLRLHVSHKPSPKSLTTPYLHLHYRLHLL